VTTVVFSCHNEILMSTDSRHVDRSMPLKPGARWAGFLGLLPFVFAFGLVTVGASQGLAPLGLQIATAWGAVILTFIAAVHWGFALAGKLPWSITTLVGSTLPSVVGAVAVITEGEKGMAILVVGFGMFWIFEHRTYAEQLPADYLDLRRVLTICVCTLLVLTAFAGSGAMP
jgi:hypothetical protein